MAASTFVVPITIDGTGSGAVGSLMVLWSRGGSAAPVVPLTGQIWPRGNRQ